MNFPKLEGWLERARRGLRGSIASPYREEGRAAAAQRKWHEAETAYRRHLELKPRDGQTWLRLANVLKDSGKYVEAEAVYAVACDKLPRSADAWLNRGHLAKIQGRVEDARNHYLRSFSLNGGSAAGREVRSLSEGASPQNFASSVVGSVDGMVGRTVSGWAIDPKRPDQSAKVQFLQNGVVIGEAITNLARADVLAAGFGNAKSGFRTSLGAAYKPDAGPVTVRLACSHKQLMNSPYQPSDQSSISRWLDRWVGVSPNKLSEVKLQHTAETHGVILSIVMPIYNPPVRWLKEAIESVISQTSGNWELICVDDASLGKEIPEVLERYAALDPRIKAIRLYENQGISKATNVGIEAAKGAYVAFMDHDDYLEPEAVFRMLEASRSRADLIYSDEVIVGEDLDDIIEIVARPAFSYDFYVSHPYFVHLVAVRVELARKVGGFDPTMAISMDVDFMLRVIEQAQAVAHVPVPLYRWRTHARSVGHVRQEAVMSSTREALKRHHDRMGVSAQVVNGKTFNTYRTDYHDDGGRVLAVIPTKNRLDLLKPCIDSILSAVGEEVDILVIDHESDEVDIKEFLASPPERVRVMPYSGEFNFSRMNNTATARYGRGYDFFLFLNNDVEAIEAGWLEHMRGICQRTDVGAVGALLLYGDDHIQHGGVVLGVGGPAEHVHKGEAYRLEEHINPGYISDLVSVRDYMAVTGACLMVRANVFRLVNGFDELLKIGFNDIDLCLRIREQGYKVLFDGHAVLYHHESATRSSSKQIAHPDDTALMSSRWADLLARGDPFFSPLFGRQAPACNVITEDIDILAPARLWRRRSPAKGRRPRPSLIKQPSPFF